MHTTPKELFEQTRARIRALVEEIAQLAAKSRKPQEFFNGFLDRTIATLQAQGAAIWVRSPEGFIAPFHRDLESSDYTSNAAQQKFIHLALQEVFTANRPCTVAALQPDLGQSTGGSAEIGNTRPHPFFYVPISVEDETVAVLHVWLADAGDPKTYHDILNFLNLLAGHAATFFKNQQGEALVHRTRQQAVRLRLSEELVGELEPKRVGTVAANHLIDLAGASRACLFRKVKNKWRLFQVSNQDAIDPKSHLVLALDQLAQALPATDEPRAIEAATAENPALPPLLLAAGAKHIAFLRLKSNTALHEPDLLLLAERHEDAPFRPNSLQELAWAGALIARAHHAADTHAQMPLRRTLLPLTGTLRMVRQKRWIALGLIFGLPLILLLLGLFYPYPLKVKGTCTIYPIQISLASSETTGKVTQVLVKEGDSVQKDQVLARLDDRDLRTQLAVALEEEARWLTEAKRQQALNDEAQRKLAEINTTRSQKAIERLNLQLSKTEIRAPISGVILTKNLRNREGELMETGKAFCEIANPEGFELMIEVDQRDLGPVMQELKSHGPVPVEFILNAFTHETLKTEIPNLEAISELATMAPNGSFFHVRAQVPAETAAQMELKPGYSGKARLLLPPRPLGEVMLRRFMDYWRVEWAL
jgi:biotin carboxyl carrier protein